MSGFEQVGDFAHLDTDRAQRRGYPEAIYCSGKSVEQVVGIAEAVRERSALFTRVTQEQQDALRKVLPGIMIDPVARLAAWPAQPPEPSGGTVLILCAGTSDLPVAKEAELTARYLGRDTELIADVGVAGIHRLLSYTEKIQAADAIVVAAGMDGALPSVVAGLASCPVVGLPTSVGYGAGQGGVAALLTMLNACAPGIGVVNIDNGYGAGHLAAQIAARK
ncbi:nickel pincer cofactor biosynthesis protein LarB [Corynebacterium tapiri]|uniref:Nickel pincer cofactor biosynthesis protein LarB n=1 Tax=Corynebacterium tapiri TaxID=1448266 RepID=A0A5C4U3F8_9CORY|nr:nickel pincer cofactor biosynthesis protein LarB [Corynebacterium tapiri]TNL95083.1 nickel pincer cofactor biosynthesis protein LarB [Corynebacterium tapiri]